MPSKPIIYTDEYPYHLVTRCNNSEWFRIPKEIVWEIYREKFLHLSKSYGFQLHAFTLMSNHSHSIGTSSETHYLGEVMNWLQTSVAREINRKSGHSNHVFGRPYKPTLITNPFYYAHAVRYIYQNPLRAGFCNAVENYNFSTVHEDIGSRARINIVSPTNGIDHLLTAMTADERLAWFNEPVEQKDASSIKKALGRTVFKIAKSRGFKKEHWMNDRLKKN